MWTAFGLSENVSAQSSRTAANIFRAEALAAKNLVAGIPFAATELSRKTRTLDVSPMYDMLWPGLASQYVAVSLTLFNSGRLATLVELWA